MDEYLKPKDDSEKENQDNSTKQQKFDYEILDGTFPKYDLTFKIIVIGNSGKKIYFFN